MLTIFAARSTSARDKQSSLSRSRTANSEDMSDRFSQMSFGGPSVYPDQDGRMPLSYFGTPMAIPTHANNPDVRFRLSETTTGNDFGSMSNNTGGSSSRDATNYTRTYQEHMGTTRNKPVHPNKREENMSKDFLSSMNERAQQPRGRGTLRSGKETTLYGPGLSTKISRATQTRNIGEERQSVPRTSLHDGGPGRSALSRPAPLAGGSSKNMGGFVSHSERSMKVPPRTSATTIQDNDHVRDDPRKDKRVSFSGKQGQTTHMSGALPVPDKKSTTLSQAVTKPSTIKKSANTADRPKDSAGKQETTTRTTQVDKALPHRADSIVSIPRAWMGSIDSRATKGSRSHRKSKK
jgi:hypothetical protein